MTNPFKLNDEKAAIFIDGENTYKASRSLSFEIDYKKVLQKASDNSILLRAYYYTLLRIDDGNDEEYSPIQPLVDYLSYNGYTVRTRNSHGFTDSNGIVKYRGSVDVELALDVLRLADKIEHIVLFSGNGSFIPLISEIKNMGVRVTVVSSTKGTQQIISDEMRREADSFIDLSDIAEDISRSPFIVKKKSSNY
jgi:uncharacterized LabA/DUF88 family protein